MKSSVWTTGAGVLLLFGHAVVAAVGEDGGAYGGGTTAQTGEISFAEADNDEDGVLSREEARRVGIERFDKGDINGDGVLDRAELASLRGDCAGDKRRKGGDGRD